MSDSLPLVRGGTCSNPFGGEERIDRINLMEYLEANAPPQKVIYGSIIQDAASNYLYAFLGKNGTSTEEFFAAHQYFFKVNSYDKASWDHHRTIKNTYHVKGEKVTQEYYLTDSELKLMCFDKHFEMSGLENHINIDRFRSMLRQKRELVVTNNWEQIQQFVTNLKQHELNQIADGQQVPLQVWTDDLRTLLIDPPSGLQLANALYVPVKLKRPRRSRAQRQLGTSVHTKLVERIAKNNLPALDSDWGPLSALLIGVSNDQAVNHNSNDSICSSLTGHCSIT